MEKLNRRKVVFLWLGLLGLCLLALLTPLMRGPDPKQVVDRIPIGSKLSELDIHLGKFYESSSVKEWSNVPTENKSTRYEKTKYGFSYARDLGEYDEWPATKAERDAFTGQIVFYRYSGNIPDDLAPSYAVRLVYKNGVLKEKDYGHLPG